MYINARGKVLELSGATNSWPTSTSAREIWYGTSRNELFQEVGGDIAYGGSGDDTYNMWDSASTAVEKKGEGVDTVYAKFWGIAVLPENIENLFLSAKYSYGGIGNALDNIIAASTAGALLDGRAGDDVLVGGTGADTFRIARGTGSDTIENFTHGVDVISLDGYGITSSSQVFAAALQIGDDVRIDLPQGDVVVIRNQQLGQLDAADFQLVNLVNSPVPDSTFDPGSAVDGLVKQVGAGQCLTVNGWYVFNNVWNPGTLVDSVDFRINSTFNPNDVTGGTVFNWDFPLVDPVTMLLPTYQIIRAYPEVMLGALPKSGQAVPTDSAHVFPIKLTDLTSMDADFDVSITGDTSGFNLAFDLYLTSVPNGGRDQITNEIMVWVHKGGFPPGGQRIGTYIDGDFAATIYNQPDTKYTAVVANGDYLKGSLDIAHLLGALREMGVVSVDTWLASVELGAEVVSGRGSFVINTLDLDVTNVAADGSVRTADVDGGGATIVTTPHPTSDTWDLTTDAQVGVDLNMASRAAAAQFRDFPNVVATGWCDTILGDARANQVDGRAEDDQLRGRDGDDTLLGGGGSDLLRGDAGDDRLEGGQGDDTLDGGVGTDLMIGGSGNDRYMVDDAADRVTEGADGGHDTVIARINYRLGDEVEDLTLAGKAHEGFGNMLDNVITGGRLSETLWGLDGHDTILGGGGNDLIYGGNGNDELCGGEGRDMLTGGAGADRFLFSNLDNGADLAAGKVDRIADYNRIEGDRIDLSAIDANARTTIDDGFVFIGGAAFSGQAGELRMQVSGSATLVLGDVDGDGTADFAFRVDQPIILQASDFIL